MRRGFTLLELALVLAVTSILFCIALPRVQRMADQLAVHNASLELISAHRRARMSAVLQARSLELTVSADTLAIRVPGTSRYLWHAPGPSAQGVRLEGPPRTMIFSPVGLMVGVSNASLRLTRGAAALTVVISRLGRLRVTP
jgi:prepilin-type N-terminal cleavage/methylation domain-containing protein